MWLNYLAIAVLISILATIFLKGRQMTEEPAVKVERTGMVIFDPENIG
jgi:hypothetical protein